MKDHPPVPSDIWKRLMDFLASERSGTIALHVRGGRVRTATISEQVSAKERGRKSSVLESRP